MHTPNAILTVAYDEDCSLNIKTEPFYPQIYSLVCLSVSRIGVRKVMVDINEIRYDVRAWAKELIRFWWI